MSLKPEDRLLIEGYMISSFLLQLNQNDFINSSYFKEMNHSNKFVPNHLPQIGIDSQGGLLIILYNMLVVPKQLLEKKYPNEFDDLNIFLKSIQTETISTYSEEIEEGNTNYYSHIRNAVAHARVEFLPGVSVTFKDERIDWKTKVKQTCSITIPLKNIMLFLIELQKIFFRYKKDLKKSIKD